MVVGLAFLVLFFALAFAESYGFVRVRVGPLKLLFFTALAVGLIDGLIGATPLDTFVDVAVALIGAVFFLHASEEEGLDVEL